MPDYELLELLLFRAIPRQDIKPLARELIDTFGDLNRVITAPIARLQAVKGVGDALYVVRAPNRQPSAATLALIELLVSSIQKLAPGWRIAAA